jgi:DNA-directed RNA polymerase specialized sigma24 family protein
MAQIIPFRQHKPPRNSEVRPAGEDAAATFDRDRAVFRLRVAGLSVPRVAEELGCSEEEVMASLDRMLCIPKKPEKPSA